MYAFFILHLENKKRNWIPLGLALPAMFVIMGGLNPTTWELLSNTICNSIQLSCWFLKVWGFPLVYSYESEIWNNNRLNFGTGVRCSKWESYTKCSYIYIFLWRFKYTVSVTIWYQRSVFPSKNKQTNKVVYPCESNVSCEVGHMGLETEDLYWYLG